MAKVNQLTEEEISRPPPSSTASSKQPHTITLADVEPQVFKAMLKYIYLDSVDFNADIVNDLAAAAKVYEMPHLLKVCLDHISTNLMEKNVLQVFSLALYFTRSEDLKKKCEELIQTRTKAVLADSSFEEACIDVVVALFSLGTLDIDSELDLLTAADRYAKHASKCAHNDDKLTVRHALEKIRFLSLTPEEFAKGRAATTVLSPSEACAVLANRAYDKSGVPMPVGFSLRKDSRKKMVFVVIKEMKIDLVVPEIANLIEKGETTFSSIFKLNDTKWKMKITSKSDVKKKFLSVCACCNWGKDGAWKCNAEVEMLLLRTDKGEPLKRNSKQEFNKDSTCWGYTEFIDTSKLNNPDNHYLEDKAITLQIHIKIIEPQKS